MDLEEFIEAIKSAAEEGEEFDPSDLDAEDRARILQQADQDGAAQTLWNWGFEEHDERNNVSELRQERNALKKEKEDLEQKVEDLEGQIDDLQGDGDGDGTDVSTLRTQKEELEDRVEELENKVDQKDDQLQKTAAQYERQRVLSEVRRKTSGQLKDVYLDHVIPSLEDRIRVNGDSDDPTDVNVEILQPDSELPMSGDDPVDRLAEEVVNNADPDFVVSDVEGGAGTEGGGSGGGGEGDLAEKMREEGESTFQDETRQQAAEKRAKMGLGEPDSE